MENFNGNKETKKFSIKKLLIAILLFALTIVISNLISIKVNNRVIITNREYTELKNFYEENAKLKSVENYLEENYLRDIDKDLIKTGQLKGMVRSLEDPYSVYLTEEEFNSMIEETSGSFGGIGVVVTPGDDNLITVVSPVEGTPGDKIGIKTGDKIIRVNDKDFSAEEMEDAVKEMKGEPGTKVNISILRAEGNGNKKELNFDITREKIKVETVVSEEIEDNIGYIRISSFDKTTHEDFNMHLSSLEKEKSLDGLVIDLRNNPGGLLDVTADIANEFLDKGVIVYTEDKHGERQYLNSDRKSNKIPIVVLVNEASASASEILAGALKDRDRAKVVGTTTFGKGIVQRLQDFPDGTGIKLTISEYFTPKGIQIHNKGVIPDVEVEIPEGVIEIGPENLKEDTQLQKAIELLRK